MVSEINFNTKLINLVSQFNCLYDTSHPDHNDRVKIDGYWVEIAGKLNSTGIYKRYGSLLLLKFCL